jgi:DNA invertase Pin-like site-specific DNA recombinase
VSQIFDIYIRVSEVGAREGESFGSPDEQEAACRAYADSRGWEVDEAITELDVSGATPVDGRELGRLVRKCEAGESAGILTRHIDRFGRNLVEGMLAYKRLRDCGARLVAVADGLDSADPGAKTMLGFRLVMAEEVYDRNRAARIHGKERAAERGVYGAAVPVGYDRDEDGRLQPNADADVVREIFRRRAAGEGFSGIAAGLPPVTVTLTRVRRRERKALTRSGARRIVMNRAYVGEQRIPGRVIAASHQPLVTEREWEAANAVRGRAPVRRGLGKGALLKGLVRCGTCGSAMHVVSYGKDRARTTYACTRGGCGAASMAVARVEPSVLWQLDLAILNREPHVSAVIEGDTRYADALTAVTEARAALAEYRDSIELQRELGVADFAAGLRVRREAVETARRSLRETPRPDSLDQPILAATLEEAGEEELRRFYRRAIAEVKVYPRAAKHRLTLRWTGAEDEVPVPAVKPVTSPVRALAKAS